jgi:hypothetical protein
MKKINGDQFFAQYPKYSNTDELKKADILVMPYYIDYIDPGFYSFIGWQTSFRDFASDSNINCLLYSEDQNTLNVYRELSAASASDFIILFGVIISTAAALTQIYQFLRDTTNGGKFRIKQIIRDKNDYYEMNEFEGTIDDYKAFMEEMRSNSILSQRKQNK